MFFFNDTATTEIYTLSLHDALPIFQLSPEQAQQLRQLVRAHTTPQTTSLRARIVLAAQDRKSTRLNSSHANISYAVFCLKNNTHLDPPSTSLATPHPHYRCAIAGVP